MKSMIKGKMVKTSRPKFDTDHILCECIKCDWDGSIEETKVNDYGNVICPSCKETVIIYED